VPDCQCGYLGAIGRAEFRDDLTDVMPHGERTAMKPLGKVSRLSESV
jgi:hypothetical protein